MRASIRPGAAVVLEDQRLTERGLVPAETAVLAKPFAAAELVAGSPLCSTAEQISD
jgi:hypothetical protein